MRASVCSEINDTFSLVLLLVKKNNAWVTTPRRYIYANQAANIYKLTKTDLIIVNSVPQIKNSL